jgi:hypothetical protein
MQASPSRPKESHVGIAFFVFLALAMLCYYPVLSPGYAVSDDFYHLARSMRVKDWFETLMVTTNLQGRPLDGLLLGAVLSQMHSVADFAYLRLASVLVIACVALCSFLALLKAGWNRLYAGSLAVAFTTVPAFQVFSAWSIASLYVLPALGGFAAVELARRTVSGVPVRRALYGLGAVLSLLMALFLYQPSAMFFWLFVAIALFDQSPLSGEKGKLLLSFCFVFGAASVADLVFFEVSKHVLGTASLLPQRSHLSTDLPAKMNWFLHGPLFESFNLNRLTPTPKFAVEIGTFLAAGLMLFFQGSFVARLSQFVFALGLIVLSYLPNLAIAENFGTYRTQTALEPLVLFYIFLASQGFYRLLQSVSKDKLDLALPFQVLTAGLCAINLMVAHCHLENFFVVPQTLELSLMKSQLEGEFGHAMQQKPISLTREETFAPFVRYDEFGLPSLAQSWVPEPVIFLLSRERAEKTKSLASTKSNIER